MIKSNKYSAAYASFFCDGVGIGGAGLTTSIVGSVFSLTVGDSFVRSAIVSLPSVATSEDVSFLRSVATLEDIGGMVVGGMVVGGMVVGGIVVGGMVVGGMVVGGIVVGGMVVGGMVLGDMLLGMLVVIKV